MKNRLFVAGDSFASLVTNQSVGFSWSELVATHFDLELFNLARPAASNFLIALQIEWICDNYQSNDIVLVYLTSHIRKTLVDQSVEHDKTKSLLELHSLHHQQKQTNFINFAYKPRFIASHIHDGNYKTKSYYRYWFDNDIQESENIFIEPLS